MIFRGAEIVFRIGLCYVYLVATHGLWYKGQVNGLGSAVLPGSGSALLAGTGSAVLPWSGGRASAGGFPEYCEHVAEIFYDMLTSEVVTSGSIKSITNKAVYADMTSSLPPPKVVMDGNKDYSEVWEDSIIQ